jgi:aminoglycoside phosphotransferase (APT) family kinase protein
MNRQTQNSGTAPVREGYRLDTHRLEQWLDAHVAGFAGPLDIEQFNGGQSNPTYKLITPDQTYVLRRKPPGALLPSAHAVDREFRVVSALHAAGFPVARPYALCTDDEVIGTWFYVMDCVDGRIIWDTSFPDAPREQRAAYFDAMNGTMAALHALDPAAMGLADYGRAGNYFTRQIGRWSRQYLEDKVAGRDDAMDRLVEWLPANMPPGDETSIVHGDFRCDNMIFDAVRPKVLAVLDWELSTLGHPLADFSYHMMMYRMPPGLLTGLKGLDLDALGIPSEDEYVAAYCRRTGRAGIEHLDFYIAFNMFRLAAIFHGIRGRTIRGNAASKAARDNATLVGPMAALAWEQTRVASPRPV